MLVKRKELRHCLVVVVDSPKNCKRKIKAHTKNFNFKILKQTMTWKGNIVKLFIEYASKKYPDKGKEIFLKSILDYENKTVGICVDSLMYPFGCNAAVQGIYTGPPLWLVKGKTFLLKNNTNDVQEQAEQAKDSEVVKQIEEVEGDYGIPADHPIFADPRFQTILKQEKDFQTNSNGNILTLFFTLTCWMLEFNICPIFFFEGTATILKLKERQKRDEAAKKVKEKQIQSLNDKLATEELVQKANEELKDIETIINNTTTNYFNKRKREDGGFIDDDGEMLILQEFEQKKKQKQEHVQNVSIQLQEKNKDYLKVSKQSVPMKNRTCVKLKKMLSLMGIPWVQSKHETDSSIGGFHQSGIIDAGLGNDFDWLCYGTKFIRYLHSEIQDAQNVWYRDYVIPRPRPRDCWKAAKEQGKIKGRIEEYDSKFIQELIGLDQQGIIDLCNICGNDYAEIPKYGPVTGLKLLLPPSPPLDSSKTQSAAASIPQRLADVLESDEKLKQSVPDYMKEAFVEASKLFWNQPPYGPIDITLTSPFAPVKEDELKQFIRENELFPRNFNRPEFAIRAWADLLKEYNLLYRDETLLPKPNEVQEIIDDYETRRQYMFDCDYFLFLSKQEEMKQQFQKINEKIIHFNQHQTILK
jgi:hypothetical protein